MAKRLVRCTKGILTSLLLALYLFLLYELLLIPAILDWSTYGVILSVVLVGLLIWCIPAEKRIPTTVLGATFLLAVKAIDNIKEYPLIKHTAAIIFIFLLLLLVGKLLGRFSFRRYLAMFLVALLLGTAADLSQVRFWPEFTVKWESPLLYKKLATVDYFPTILADVDGDKTKEIITQQNMNEAIKEQKERAADGEKYSILEPEQNYFSVYKWDGQSFREILPEQYSMAALKSALPRDYVGYPFYQTTLGYQGRTLSQRMTPLLDRAGLVEAATNFGSFPFKLLAMDQEDLNSRLSSENAVGLPPASDKLAAGNLIPGPPTEQVRINQSLVVTESAPKGEQAAELKPSQIPDISTSEVLTADVNQDKTDELLLTAANSRIMKLTPGGQWQTLWASPEAANEKFRFQGFRFEDFAALGADKTPQIIALSKSNVRENPTRYMTGYTYQSGALKQQWRVFSGLINLRAGDVDGDGQNELVGYMYRQQRVYVLKKHYLPVVPTLYILTAGLIIYGFFLQRRARHTTAGGEAHV